jgi:hypothetical protein
MSVRFEKSVSTLGEDLTRQVAAMRQRCLPRIERVELLQPVIERVLSRPSSAESRFRRVESPSRAPTVPQAKSGIPLHGEQSAEGSRELSGWTRQRLRELLGRGADEVRVHDSRSADRIAREHRADAVTLGRDVYFREGRFNPEDRRGFALLAHEATHVVEAMVPGAAWRRATGAGVAEEEMRALSNEIQLLGLEPLRPPSGSKPSPVRESSPATASSVALRPMKAEVDRSPTAPAASLSQGPSLDELRKTLFRDILSQVRVEFERGA